MVSLLFNFNLPAQMWTLTGTPGPCPFLTCAQPHPGWGWLRFWVGVGRRQLTIPPGEAEVRGAGLPRSRGSKPLPGSHQSSFTEHKLKDKINKMGTAEPGALSTGGREALLSWPWATALVRPSWSWPCSQCHQKFWCILLSWKPLCREAEQCVPHWVGHQNLLWDSLQIRVPGSCCRDFCWFICSFLHSFTYLLNTS